MGPRSEEGPYFCTVYKNAYFSLADHLKFMIYSICYNKISERRKIIELSAKNIQVAYQQKNVISDLSIAFEPNKITTIIGANGCGKSTLLKALTRLWPVAQGEVMLAGRPLLSLDTKEIARRIAFLPQSPKLTTATKVYDLVSYGRYPYQKGFGRLTASDKQKIDQALELTATKHLKDNLVEELSGGQRQRVFIAMTLVQDTDIIVLDEPTTYLDMNHQLEIMEILQKLKQEENKTIIMVLHDINLAARFSDELVAMRAGKIVKQDAVSAVMTPEVLREVFRIDAQLIQDPTSGRPLLLNYQLCK